MGVGAFQGVSANEVSHIVFTPTLAWRWHVLVQRWSSPGCDLTVSYAVVVHHLYISIQSLAAR